MFDSYQMRVLIKIFIFLSLILGIIYCISLISDTNITNRESSMLGILLTVLSVLASWVITHLYAESQYRNAIEEVRADHRNNLRTYALKAAEKVNNLSNEIHKLTIYLETELNYTDYRNTEEELLAKEERIESVIHLLRTLKSVNDTSLSDWEGVIGDELDQKREEKLEREEELVDLISRVETFLEDHRQGFLGTVNENEEVRNRIEELKKEIRVAIFQLNDSSIPRSTRKRSPKQLVKTSCSCCSTSIEYKQRTSETSYKSVTCKNCGKKFLSTFSKEKGFSLSEQQNVETTIDCPSCKFPFKGLLGNFPGSRIIAYCPNCNSRIRATRRLAYTEIKVIEQINNNEVSEPLSDDFIERVRILLPPQPWPTGIHKSISKEMDSSVSSVSNAIDKLIKRGIFNPQYDGVVYVPIQTQEREQDVLKS